MTNPLFYSMIEEDYLKGIRSDAAYDGKLCYYSPTTNNLYCGGGEKISVYDVDKKPMTFVEFLLNVFVYFPVIFSIAFGVAGSFIAFFVWKPMVEDGEKAFQEEEARIEKIRNKYENKYPVEKHSKVDEDDEEEDHDSLQYSIIMENVPDLGNVVMRYNAEKKGFDYWADRIIPQRFLCTVARKYVNSFKSFDIYTAEAEEILNSDSDESVESNESHDEKSESSGLESDSDSESEKADEEKEKKEEKPTNSVFASYKNYKTNEKKGNDENTKKEKPVDKKINSFFYQGKINNFEILSKVKDEETEKEKSWYSPVTFADFKKLATSSSS